MKSTRSLMLPFMAAVFAAGAAFAAYKWRRLRFLELKITEMEAALEHAQQQRAAERTGRIRAQRDLRKSLGSNDTGNSGDIAYPMTPIGTIHSCFTTRNGTPRQPLLVPLAKAHLVLSPGGVPHEALEGLALYSHCWVLYVFHENTDLQRLWSRPAHRDLRAKVRVPRLDGGKMGIFATRTPHRPCPIGLSVAKVEGVHGGILILSGVDLVDGTPVLDLKPYLTYCDSVPHAVTPTWVKAGGSDDILAMACVQFTDKFKEELTSCWESMGKHSLYSSTEEFQRLLEQVLSRDIRSLCQRQRPHNAVMNSFERVLEFGDAAGYDQCKPAAESRSTQQVSGDYAADDGLGELAKQFNGGEKVGTGIQHVDESNALSPDQPALSSTQEAGTCLKPYESSIETHRLSTPIAVSNFEGVVYHLILEGISISYSVNLGHVVVGGATLTPRCLRTV